MNFKEFVERLLGRKLYVYEDALIDRMESYDKKAIKKATGNLKPVYKGLKSAMTFYDEFPIK